MLNISKTVGDSPKLLFMTNRKLHNALLIDTKNDDLDDLELYKFSENLSGFRIADFERNSS